MADAAPDSTSVASTGAGPLPAYRALVARGALAPDAAQRLAAERLQTLWVRLRGYDPPPRPAAEGLLSRLWRRRPTEGAPDDRPNGLYLVGDVGRGKSMLMDLFYAVADVPRRRRVPFHRFMQEAPARIHAWRCRASAISVAPGCKAARSGTCPPARVPSGRWTRRSGS